MFIDSEALKDSLLLDALTNGDAYRDNKNATTAIYTAKQAALKTFREYLDEAAKIALSELNADWYAEETQEAAQSEWNRIIKALSSRQVVEVTESFYDEMLGAVPPLDMGSGWFYMGEPYSHTGQGTPIHLKCWTKDGKYYGQYQEVK